MKTSLFFETLELGLPILSDSMVWRLIDNTIKVGASCNGEPIYYGDYNCSALYLAQKVTLD